MLCFSVFPWNGMSFPSGHRLPIFLFFLCIYTKPPSSLLSLNLELNLMVNCLWYCCMISCFISFWPQKEKKVSMVSWRQFPTREFSFILSYLILWHAVWLCYVKRDKYLVNSASCVISDIDECQEQQLCTRGHCENTEGSFSCQCGQGFKVSSAGDQCEGRVHWSFTTPCTSLRMILSH